MSLELGFYLVSRPPVSRRLTPVYFGGPGRQASEAKPPIDDDLCPFDVGERLPEALIQGRIVPLDDDEPPALVGTDLIDEGRPRPGRRGAREKVRPCDVLDFRGDLSGSRRGNPDLTKVASNRVCVALAVRRNNHLGKPPMTTSSRVSGSAPTEDLPSAGGPVAQRDLKASRARRPVVRVAGVDRGTFAGDLPIRTEFTKRGFEKALNTDGFRVTHWVMPSALARSVREPRLWRAPKNYGLVRSPFQIENAGAPLRIPRPGLCTDNAAMIACCGYFHLERGERDDYSLDALPGLELTIKT